MDQLVKATWDLLLQDSGGEDDEETFVSLDSITVQPVNADRRRKYSKELYHNVSPLEKVEEYEEALSPDYEYNTSRQSKNYRRSRADEPANSVRRSMYAEERPSGSQSRLRLHSTDASTSTRSSKRLHKSSHSKESSKHSHSRSHDRRSKSRASDDASERSKSFSKSRKDHSRVKNRHSGRSLQRYDDNYESEHRKRDQHPGRSSRRYDNDYEYVEESREPSSNIQTHKSHPRESYSKSKSARSMSMELEPVDHKYERRSGGRTSRRYMDDDSEYLEEPYNPTSRKGRKSKSKTCSKRCACPHCGSPSISSSKRDFFAAARLSSPKSLLGKR